VASRGHDPALQKPLHDIEVIVAAADSPVRIECTRAAQRILRHGCKTVGLMPASAQVGVVGAGLNIAVAMAELTGSTIAYVDANLRWPALPQLVGKGAEEDPSDPTAGSAFSTKWLRGDVALLVPKARAVNASGLAALARVLVSAQEVFACCLVDLTGWRRLGEHLTAFTLLDGLVTVAHKGLTTEDDLLQLSHELPAARSLGVVLLGATL
jgi:hypothetical protein